MDLKRRRKNIQGHKPKVYQIEPGYLAKKIDSNLLEPLILRFVCFQRYPFRFCSIQGPNTNSLNRFIGMSLNRESRSTPLKVLFERKCGMFSGHMLQESHPLMFKPGLPTCLISRSQFESLRTQIPNCMKMQGCSVSYRLT